MYFEIIIWWLALVLIGFIALPVTGYLCRGLPDMGYSVSKIIGLLLLTYFSWILAFSGLGYSTFSVFISLFLMLAVSCIFYKYFGLSINKSFAIKNEFFFISIFIVFLIIRSFSPDTYWEVSEKFMDMAFINSILRSSSFPPMDPWFSGMPMNYYYFGYLLVADMVKLTGTALPTGFNIASAIFFALSAGAIFGISFGLIKKVSFGLVGVVFVLFLGNLVGFVQMLVILFFPAYYERFYVPDSDLSTRLSTFSRWPSANVIPGSISETPYDVYLIGDLHPNVVSISFQLLILAVLLNAIKERKITYLQAFMLGMIAGFFYPLNTWDYPTYIMITLAVVFLTTGDLRKSILLSGILVISSFILYLPYHLNYKTVHEIVIITTERTELIRYLLIFGVFIFIITYCMTYNSNQPVRRDLSKRLAGLLILLFIAFIIKFQLLILLVPLLLLSISGMARAKDPARIFIFLLVLIGVLLSFFVELFYIKDALNKQAYFRYNTIFKLYLQTWILWGIAASYFFYGMMKKKVAYVACILILMASIYPVFITISESKNFNIAPTLDAERSIRIEYPYEYEAIEWLRSINGTPVVLQAAGFSYAWNSYVSAFTGLPTVLGWEFHEYQWRNDLEEINRRRNDVERIYVSSSYEEIKDIILKYKIKYIYIGPIERERYEITDLFARCPGDFKLVFKNRDVKIYQVQW